MTCTRLCGPQRQPCPNPWKCSATFCHFTDMNTASDTGHKVAYGKRIDYLGKAAEEEPAPPAPSRINWFKRPSWLPLAVLFYGSGGGIAAGFYRFYF